MNPRWDAILEQARRRQRRNEVLRWLFAIAILLLIGFLIGLMF